LTLNEQLSLSQQYMNHFNSARGFVAQMGRGVNPI
jgi:hypothetical protein